MSDLSKAFEHFKNNYDRFTELFRYYDGQQPLRYSATRLKDAFNQIDVKFRQNWCAVVINSVLDRIELYGWSTADDETNQILARSEEHTSELQSRI